MASDDTMTLLHSSIHENEYDAEDEDNHPLNLSRLSMCNDNDDGGGDITDMGMCMSRLSMEGLEGDADEETSDSEKEAGGCSVPATLRRWRIGRGSVDELREYGSEKEAQKGNLRDKKGKNSRRKSVRERWVEKKKDEEEMEMEMESECLVIARPKGGRRSLCMDLEEVKACRDLGFELEHERMLEIPTRISISGSPIDTSSGGNSPIANWRISSPGDDPRDVKARLKVWAQAVALASATRLLS